MQGRRDHSPETRAHALDLLADGVSKAEVARRVGANRGTVERWALTAARGAPPPVGRVVFADGTVVEGLNPDDVLLVALELATGAGSSPSTVRPQAQETDQ